MSDQDDDDDGGDERGKVLKQLAFPDIESGKFNPQDYPKVSSCIQKRVAKLNQLVEKFQSTTIRNQVQEAFLAQLPKTAYIFKCVFLNSSTGS